jgi:hypothetical protein
MNTVLRVGGLRFMIFVDDHAPAHVHVIGDGVAKVNLVGTDGNPWIVWSKGMTLAEQRRALAAVSKAQAELLDKWKQIHG